MTNIVACYRHFYTDRRQTAVRGAAVIGSEVVTTSTFLGHNVTGKDNGSTCRNVSTAPCCCYCNVSTGMDLGLLLVDVNGAETLQLLIVLL